MSQSRIEFVDGLAGEVVAGELFVAMLGTSNFADLGNLWTTREASQARCVDSRGPEMKAAARKVKRAGRPARVFADFRYRTRKSWSAERRVIGKAEFTNGGASPRFIDTNVHAIFGSPRFRCETVYSQRGEMENRLKACQGDLFADRTPTHTSCRRRASGTMRANQLRLWLSSLAFVLRCSVSRIVLAGTELVRAT